MVDAPVGVLALQGDFAEHLNVLQQIGVEACEVRSHAEIDQAQALIIPGGESTTILKLVDLYDLRDILVKKITDGMPVFGTCAGAIVLAKRVSDGEAPLACLDATIMRNAYGRQVDSFEAVVNVKGIGDVAGAFIRAPIIEQVEEDAEVLAEHEGHPVLVRQANILVSTFHPEILGETRVHRMFIDDLVRGQR